MVGTQKRQEANHGLEETADPSPPDCGSVMNPSLRTQHLDSASYIALFHACRCPPCFSGGNFPLFLQLAKPSPGPLSVPPCPPRMPPFPCATLYAWFIYSQISVKCRFFVYPVWRNPQAATLCYMTLFYYLYNALHSLKPSWFLFTYLESESSYWNVSSTGVRPVFVQLVIISPLPRIGPGF